MHNLKTSAPRCPIWGPIYETKTALILRRDLAGWQWPMSRLPVAGLAGTHGHLMGEPYATAAAAYTALIREPVFAHGATLEELRRSHQRSCREPVPAIYIEPMFKTTNDADNRAAAAAAPDALISSSASTVRARPSTRR
jgi:hypothetical protein